MPASPLIRPDVLVLAGGGTLGVAWMTGLLAGIEDAGGLDLRETESFVGTSAGSIVAARLAAGAILRRPRSIQPALEPGTPDGSLGAKLAAGVGAGTAAAAAGTAPVTDVDGVTRPAAVTATRAAVGRLGAAGPGALDALERAAGQVLAPIIGPALRLERLPGGLLRSGVMAIVPDGTRSLAELERSIDHDRVRFDGRLRIVGVDRHTGRRVVFGSPGAPEASVGQAVAASCAIPGFFHSIEIGGREYVDGGVWSLTNLDAAPAGRRTELLCLNPMRGLPVSPTSGLGLVSRAARIREALELAVVRGRGARVRVIGPAPESGRLMARGLMDPGPREAVLHAAYAQGLALARRRSDGR